MWETLIATTWRLHKATGFVVYKRYPSFVQQNGLFRQPVAEIMHRTNGVVGEMEHNQYFLLCAVFFGTLYCIIDITEGDLDGAYPTLGRGLYSGMQKPIPKPY